MTAPIRRRTRAREIAMQILFQLDLRGDAYPAELGMTLAQVCADAAEGDDEIAGYAARLVEGTWQNREAIDARLKAVARNWDLRRMANVDRNVLRLAVYELGWCADVPPKVAINEAIEIGKKFSTANTGGFVNGILDRVRIDLDKERAAQKSAAAAAGAPASSPAPIAAEAHEAQGDL